MKVWLKACESRNRLFTSRNGTVWILYGVATRRKYRGRDGTQTPLWWGSWWCLYSINCKKKKDIQYLIRKFLKQTNHFNVKEAKIKEDKQQLEGKTTQQLHMHQDNLKKGKKKVLKAGLSASEYYKQTVMYLCGQLCKYISHPALGPASKNCK